MPIRRDIIDTPIRRVDPIRVVTTIDSRKKDFENLKKGIPVLMLPVRIETRFLPTKKPTSLKIRVFPDRIFMNEHETKLTKDEYKSGKKFWKDLAKFEGSDNYEENRKQAWGWLVSIMGTARAAYVAQKTENKNIPSSQLREDNDYTVMTSKLLPDYWFVVGYKGSKRILETVSSAIDPDLCFSPNLQNAEEIPTDLSVDPAIKWMVDFDEAKNKGMGVEVSLTDDMQNGFDKLYVLGIKIKDKDANLTPKKAAKYFADTLNNHFYTEGAGFVPQGMPTNNTEEVNTGWSAFAEDLEAVWHRSFTEKDTNKTTTPETDTDLTCSGAMIPNNDTSISEKDKNYNILEQALGLQQNSILKSFEYREGFEQKAMQAMNTALWGVTLGEYLQSLLSTEKKSLLSSEEISYVQDWTQTYVKGGASLPTIRIGETPYGILPIQAADHMQPKDKYEKKLFEILQKLSENWVENKSSAVQLTQFAQGSGAISDRLLDLLSQQPNPVKFSGKQLSNNRSLILFWYELIKMALFDKKYSVLTETLQKYTTADLDDLYTKTYSSSSIEKSTYILVKAQIEAESKSVTNRGEKKTITQGLDILDMLIDVTEDHYMRAKEINSLIPDMIDTNLRKEIDDPQIVYSRYKSEEDRLSSNSLITIKKDDGTTILPAQYLSYLKQYTKSLLNSRNDAGTSPLQGQGKPLLYQLVYTAIGRVSNDTPRTRLNTEAISPNQPKFKNLRAKRLNELVTALSILETLPEDQLELLMQQTLGLFGWRLDAWYGSMHSKRLQDLRNKKEAGLQLGAFGWVENLKPRSKTVTGNEISEGFIHTPSLNHAKTAAVLRSGYQAYREEGTNTPFAVDLSSERMYTASWMFDAVRQGQDLGDVLGYAFERVLHEGKKDHWVYPVREAVLSFTQEKSDPKSPVVDGLALYDLWAMDTQQTNFLKHLSKSEYSDGLDLKEVTPFINKLADMRDALADAAIADSVHSLVQGNTARAGATLTAVGQGDIAPPELNILKTQRKGMTLTHKVMMLMPAEKASNTVWAEEDNSLRTKLFTDTEHMLSSIIGDIKNIKFDVAYRLPDDTYIKQETISLADISKQDTRFSLGVLDVLPMLPTDVETHNSAITEWIKLFLNANKPDNIPAEAEPYIEDTDNTQDSLLLLMGWRDVLDKTRAIKIEDFMFDSTEENIGTTSLPDEFITHLKSGVTTLRNLYKRTEFIANIHEQDGALSFGGLSAAIQNIEEIFLTSMRFLLTENIPTFYHQDEKTVIQTAISEIRSIADKLTKRLEKIDNLVGEDNDFNALDNETLHKIANIIIGHASPSFSLIELSQMQATTWSNSIKRTNMRFENSETDSYVWLEKMQYVRPHLKCFSEALLTQDSAGFVDGGGNFAVAQFPDIDGEKWTAMSLPQDKQIEGQGHRQSVLVLMPPHVTPADFATGKMTGIMVDEVVERLPSNEEDTGIALHFDAPNSEPPQVMLLAMAPERKSWNFDLMLDTLKHSLDWSRMRGLDDENITELDQHLPAVFAAKNLTLARGA